MAEDGYYLLYLLHMLLEFKPLKGLIITVQLRWWISHAAQTCLFAQSASCFATCQGNVRRKAANWSDILGSASLGKSSKSGRMEDARACCSASSSSSFRWEGLVLERVVGAAVPCRGRHLWARFQNSACVAPVADIASLCTSEQICVTFQSLRKKTEKNSNTPSGISSCMNVC